MVRIFIIDCIGLTGFRCSIHINYAHIFMVCIISQQLHEYSQICRSWGLLHVLQHQIWSSLNGLTTSEANEELFFSEEPGENQLFHFDLNTQGCPKWSETRKKFAWTGEPRSAEFCTSFINYPLFCALFLDNKLWSGDSASAVNQWFWLWITLVTHRSVKSLFSLLGMFYWAIKHISSNK